MAIFDGYGHGQIRSQDAIPLWPVSAAAALVAVDAFFTANVLVLSSPARSWRGQQTLVPALGGQAVALTPVPPDYVTDPTDGSYVTDPDTGERLVSA